MSIRPVAFVSGEYYHIYNRGNSKQQIFHNKEDYNHFIKLLFICNSTKNFKLSFLSGDIYEVKRGDQLVSIGAYCLMPNHFHILVTPIEEGSLSKFMLKLSTAYSVYYNKKYERTGSLFEGKFKSKYLDTDIYLKYVFSYIHLNPVKIIDSEWKEKGLKNKIKVLDFLGQYYYSSYLDYMGILRKENKILNRENFPDYFPTVKSFKREIFDWFKILL